MLALRNIFAHRLTAVHHNARFTKDDIFRIFGIADLISQDLSHGYKFLERVPEVKVIESGSRIQADLSLPKVFSITFVADTEKNFIAIKYNYVNVLANSKYFFKSFMLKCLHEAKSEGFKKIIVGASDKCNREQNIALLDMLSAIGFTTNEPKAPAYDKKTGDFACFFDLVTGSKNWNLRTEQNWEQYMSSLSKNAARSLWQIKTKQALTLR